MNQGSRNGASGQAGESYQAENHPHSGAELAKVICERGKTDDKDGLNGRREETVNGGTHVDSAARVSNANPAVYYDGDQGRCWDRRVEWAAPSRRDEAWQNSPRNTETIRGEQNVD